LVSFQIDESYTFTFNMIDLKDKGIDNEWIKVIVFVTDDATFTTMASEKAVKIIPEKPIITIEHLQNKNAFLPGLNFSTTVHLLVICVYFFTKIVLQETGSCEK